MSAGRVIAVVGAPGTGKHSLAQLIAARLQAHDIAAVHVDALGDAQSRHPPRVPHGECAALAAAQTRRIDAAAARGVAVTGITALTMAIDCDLRFADRSLYAEALATQRRYTLTLLAATDPAATGERAEAATFADGRVRRLLADAGVPFTVVHGRGEERLTHAWNALQHLTADTATKALPADRTARAGQAWAWSCETCSDPACEHRLFSDLVAARR